MPSVMTAGESSAVYSIIIGLELERLRSDVIVALELFVMSGDEATLLTIKGTGNWEDHPTTITYGFEVGGIYAVS